MHNLIVNSDLIFVNWQDYNKGKKSGETGLICWEE